MYEGFVFVQTPEEYENKKLLIDEDRLEECTYYSAGFQRTDG